MVSRKVEAEKRVSVHESPNALVLHMKRFSHSFAKLNQQVLELVGCIGACLGQGDDVLPACGAHPGSSGTMICDWGDVTASACH